MLPPQPVPSPPPAFSLRLLCVLGGYEAGRKGSFVNSKYEVRHSQGGMERLLDWVSRTRVFILALTPTRYSRGQFTSHLSVSSSVKRRGGIPPREGPSQDHLLHQAPGLTLVECGSRTGRVEQPQVDSWDTCPCWTNPSKPLDVSEVYCLMSKENPVWK